MMSHPRVSVIIPALNEEKYLPLCLDSLSNLNSPKELIEIIVIDNGSTDQTRQIAENFGVQVYCSDSKTISGLRNLGVKKSSGEVIAFVDADCAVSKDWLNSASIYFDDLSIIAWGAPPKLPQNTTWVQEAWFLVRQKQFQKQEVDWLETANTFVRKEQFLQVDGFNESLITGEDVDLSYRLRKYGKIISDNRIDVVHLREAATVNEFIKKEIWRGQSNLKGVLSHGFFLKELPSISIPLYFGILLPTFFLGFIISHNVHLLWIFLALYIIPTLIVLQKIRKKKVARFKELFRLSILLQVYFLSRTVAVLKEQKHANA